MYRAHKWTTAASKVLRESSRPFDKVLLAREVDRQIVFKRNNIVSSTRGGFSLIKLAVSSVIAAGATIGTAIFYAGRDERIRDDFENKVPLAKTVLTSVYGEKSKPEEHSDNQDTLFPKSKEEKKEEKTFSPESSELVTTNVSKKKSDDVSPANAESQEVHVDEKQNNVVVITTIDDQAAVSSVDLDISNAKSQPKKKKKKAKKKLDKEVKKSQDEKSKSESLEDASTETAVAASTAVLAVGDENFDQPPEKETSEKNIAESAVEPTAEAMVEPVAEPMNEMVAVVKEKDSSVDELATIAENVDKLEQENLLQSHVVQLQDAQNVAIQKQVDALDSLKVYTEQLVKASSLSEDSVEFDEQWKQAAELEHKSQILMDEAKESELKIQANIEAIYEMVKGLRSIGPSDVADLAQDAATKTSLLLLKATDDVKAASKDLLKISEQNLVASDDIKKEVLPLFDKEAAIEGEVDNKCGNETLTDNVLLTYAMKKIGFLKSQLENLRAEEQEKFEKKLQEVKDEEGVKTGIQLQMQEEALKKEFEVLMQKKEADLLEEFEDEIRKQLKRQSAAHREHLTDVLQAHTEKLIAEHKRTVEQELRRQKLIHDNEMNEVASHLHGIESMIDTVIDAEKKNSKTREFWLAVQSLASVLNEESPSGRTKNLMPELAAISKLAENDATVQFILGTIPESAAIRGVSIEGELKKRFADVKRICKRVAMVADADASLWTYILSAVRSFVVFETHAKRDIQKEVDPETLNAYEILAKAQHCIEEDDFELAVKFMSLLKGLPRRLAGDWIKEARAYLETRQASEFLLAYAASEA